MADDRKPTPMPEHVSLRDVYSAVDRLEEKINDRFATKSELRMWIALGLVGGQAVAAAITAYLTGKSLPAQAMWAYGKVRGWL